VKPRLQAIQGEGRAQRPAFFLAYPAQDPA